MMPYRYNNGIQILQAPGIVVLNLEMIHEARIIYTDGRAPLKPVLKQYMGESRGRWEGNTLVVETTNYKPGPVGHQHRRHRLAGRQPLPGERPDEDDRAVHAAERRQ